MAEKVRYNKVIDLLEQGKPVFSSGLVWNGNLDDLVYVADSDYDMVMIEMEHEGLSFNNLRVSLQFLLNRKSIAEKGNAQPDVVPPGTHSAELKGAQPVGHKAGPGHRGLWLGVAPHEHRGGSPVRCGGGPLSPGPRRG
jgi:hypothetical protein